jgi:glycosyltransferase involved in cell wall biosynthesis
MRVALNMLFVGGGVAGGRVYCEGLLRGLAAVAGDEEFVSFVRGGVSVPSLPARFTEFRARVSGESVLKRTAWEYLRLPGAIRRGRFDVFHALGNVSPAPRGTPFVLTVHDQIYRHFPASMPFGHRWFTRFVQSGIARRADRVIVPSASARQDVIRFLRVDPDRMRVIPYGAGNVFRPIEDATVTGDTVRRFGVRRPYILSVARGYPHKNLGGLLRAVARLTAPAVRDASLVLVGERYMVGRQLDRLIDELGLSDRVRFTGFASNDDLNALYCGAAVFAFPSLAEGLGLPVLEAMACGVPVVASNESAVPEAVGDAGVVANARDPAAFAAALEAVLGDQALRADLARRGLARAAEFTWEKCAARTLDVYRELT